MTIYHSASWAGQHMVKMMVCIQTLVILRVEFQRRGKVKDKNLRLNFNLVVKNSVGKLQANIRQEAMLPVQETCFHVLLITKTVALGFC